MAKDDPRKIEDELKRQEEDFYGDEAPGGSTGQVPGEDDSEDLEDQLHEVTGDDIDQDDELDIAARVNHDEKAILHDDLDEDDEEDPLDDEEDDSHIDDEPIIDPFGLVIGKDDNEDDEDDLGDDEVNDLDEE